MPAKGSRMQAEAHDPRTVTKTSSDCLLMWNWPGKTLTIQAEVAASKNRRPGSESVTLSPGRPSERRNAAPPIIEFSDRSYGQRDRARGVNQPMIQNVRCKASRRA